MAANKYEKGDTIFREGDESQEAFYVLAGRVRVSINSPSGPKVLAELGPGEILGEMGMIEDAPRAATALAVEPTTLEVVDESLFGQMILGHPERLRSYLAVLFERLRQTNAALRLAEKRRAGTTEEEADAPSSELAVQTATGALETQTPADAAEAPTPTVRLQSQYGAASTAKPIDLEIEEFPFKIGREATIAPGGSPFSMNDLYLQDRTPWNVSRNHCAIECRGGRIAVKDRGSKLGTLVNGQPIGVRFNKMVVDLKPGDNELILGFRGSPHKFVINVS